MVIDRVPSVEMVRFVSSGTEACLSVLRLMRAYTGREKIIKFTGCYHGHADSFLVKAGSGVITLGLPDSPGGSAKHRRALNLQRNTSRKPAAACSQLWNACHHRGKELSGDILQRAATPGGPSGSAPATQVPGANQPADLGARV